MGESKGMEYRVLRPNIHLREIKFSMHWKKIAANVSYLFISQQK